LTPLGNSLKLFLMRKVILANDEYYHVFNRSIERQPIFTNRREYSRGILAFDFYRFANPSLKLSKALTLEVEAKEEFFRKLKTKDRKLVEIISYCLMPNHFHFLLKQKLDNGVVKFMSNFTNSYTRYFNTRHKRIGPVLQGGFKAVWIETDEQLIHVSRYIHLNPTTSFLIKKEILDTYPWSSLPEYLTDLQEKICDNDIVLGQFSSKKDYKKFVYNQVDYARRLGVIKHLIFE